MPLHEILFDMKLRISIRQPDNFNDDTKPNTRHVAIKQEMNEYARF